MLNIAIKYIFVSVFKAISILFLKCKRRLREKFINIKHRYWFARGQLLCFCKNKHETQLFSKFAPVVKQLLQSLFKTQRMPSWSTNDLELKAICAKIMQGKFLLFENVWLDFKNNAPDWFSACFKVGCVDCSQDFGGCKFSADLWLDWSQKLNKNCCLNPDMRIVWEKSRLQFLLPLALLYQKNNDPEIANFVQKILRHWLEENPFLHGPNWTCAMEAAIRATNLIWLACLIPLGATLELQLINNLCLHRQFIFDRWEDFYKPNNHLLADILGIIYLAAFFGDEDVLKKYLSESELEFCRQINFDFSSYEASTGYHRLVTEFFLHKTLLARILNFSEVPTCEQKLQSMLKFLDAATLPLQTQCGDLGPAQAGFTGNIIKFGDVDDAKFVFGLQSQRLSLKDRYLWPEFGLWRCDASVYSIAMRLPVRAKNAPTGHLHEDFLSFDLNIGNKQFFIDPGSGFYTRHPRQRNFLRSFASHSTFFSETFLQTSFKHNLFCTNLAVSEVDVYAGPTQVFADYILQGQKLSRKIQILSQEVLIEDVVESCSEQKWFWSFVLAPGVAVAQLSFERWLLSSGNEKIIFTSSCALQKKYGLFARSYGQLEPVIVLRSCEKFGGQKLHRHKISSENSL